MPRSNIEVGDTLQISFDEGNRKLELRVVALECMAQIVRLQDEHGREGLAALTLDGATQFYWLSDPIEPKEPWEG